MTTGLRGYYTRRLDDLLPFSHGRDFVDVVGDVAAADRFEEVLRRQVSQREIEHERESEPEGRQRAHHDPSVLPSRGSTRILNAVREGRTRWSTA